MRIGSANYGLQVERNRSWQVEFGCRDQETPPRPFKCRVTSRIFDDELGPDVRCRRLPLEHGDGAVVQLAAMIEEVEAPLLLIALHDMGAGRTLDRTTSGDK